MGGELESARRHRILDGILYKKSRYIKELRKRRVILTPDQILTFNEESDDEEDATEIFDVTAVTEIVEEGYREDSDGKLRYAMKLTIRPKSRMPGRLYEWLRVRHVQLEARTPKDRMKWIQAIQSRSDAKIIYGPGIKGEHIDQDIHGSPFDESEECVICFLPIVESPAAYRLHCGHKFCAPCLSDWADQQRRCPLCKRLF